MNLECQFVLSDVLRFRFATLTAYNQDESLYFQIISGGYFHGITSLTYGVDMERIRWLGILQVLQFVTVSLSNCYN